MAALKHRFQASSLVEVTVAAVILVVIFSLALTICAHLALSGPNRRKLRCQLLARLEAAETIRTKAWYARTTTLGSFTLDRRVLPYQGNKALLDLRIEVTQAGQVLASYEELVYNAPQDAL